MGNQGSHLQPSEEAKHIERQHREKETTETSSSGAKHIERKQSEKETAEASSSGAKHIERKQSETETTETPLGDAKPKTVVVKKAADCKGPDVKAANASVARAVKLPHNYEAIIRDADSSTPDGVSVDKLHDQLCNTGVFLNNKRKKYWVDEKSNSNCFTLYARNLSITWGDDDCYWNWQHRNETRNYGKFDTRVLSPDILSEVVFVMMLNANAYGWEVPVNLILTLPNGSKQEQKENFMTKPRGRYPRRPSW